VVEQLTINHYQSCASTMIRTNFSNRIYTKQIQSGLKLKLMELLL